VLAAEVGRPDSVGYRLETRLTEGAPGCLRGLVLGVGEQRRAGEDHRHRVRDVLSLERGGRAVGCLRHERARHVVLAERDQQRLGAGDGAEEREHEVGEDVSVAVERRNHHRRATGRNEEREGRVDELRLVRHLGMARGRFVHLLLEHPFVNGADGVLRATEHLRARSLGLPKRELRDGVADASLDALGAKCDLVVTIALAPLFRTVRVADRHADDGDRRVDPAERHDAGDPAAGADDHLPADLLAKDPVGRADVAGALRRDRRRLQSQATLANRRGRFVDDSVLGGPAALQREVEADEAELEADDVGLERAHRFLEQLLPGLVALEDGDGQHGEILTCDRERKSAMRNMLALCEIFFYASSLTETEPEGE
jgi:hypothetical protein